MLKLLVDTCVWLDMAKDYRHQPTLAALEQMIEAGEVSLILPQQSVVEFARNKERIIRDSARSLSSHFKRVKEAVKQFGPLDGRDQVLSSLDDVDHRIVILGEAVQESVSQIEKLFSTVRAIEANAQRTMDRCPDCARLGIDRSDSPSGSACRKGDGLRDKTFHPESRRDCGNESIIAQRVRGGPG